MAISGGSLGGATKAASLEVDVKADTDKAEKQLGNFGSKLGSTIKSGAAVAGAALAGIGIAAGAGLVKAIGAASDLNEIISKSNTVFGKSASTVEQWANGSAKALGQTKAQALDAASTFGNLFVQLGIGSDEAAKMSMSMTGLASDFASFHNADISEVISAQTAAFRGEYDALQRFVPTINAATVEAKALEMGLAGSTKELTAQDKALATQALMMSGAGDAMGDFARTSGGLANQQRILTALWGDAVAKLGQVFLPIAIKVAGFLIERFMPAFQGVVDGITAFGNAWGKAADGVTSSGFAGTMERLSFAVHAFWTALSTGMTENEGGTWFEDLALTIRKLWGTFTQVGGKLLDWFGEAIEAMGGMGNVAKILGIALGSAGLVKEINDVVKAVSQTFVVLDKLKLLMAANPAVIWIAAIVALVAALIYAYQHSEKFREIVQSIWEFIQTSVIPILQELGAQLMTTFTELWATVQEVWPGIQESITHVLNVIMDVVNVTLGIISDIWARYGQTILDVVKVAFNYIQETISNALQVIQGIIQVVTGLINGDWSAVWEGIKNIFGGVWDQIGNILSTAMGLVREVIQAGLGVIDQLWDNTFGRMVSFVSDVFSNITSAVTGGIGKITQAIGTLPGKVMSILGAVKEAGLKVGSAIIDGIGSGLSKVAGFAVDLVSAIGGAFKKVVNSFIDRLNDAIPNKLGWGFTSINIPDNPIPKLAKGGIFDRPFFAMIAEAGREAVLPLTNPMRMRQILSDPSIGAAVAAALPWAKLAGQALSGANVQVNNTGGQGADQLAPLIGQLQVIGSQLTADDVMRAAAWEAHTRSPIAGRRG